MTDKTCKDCRRFDNKKVFCNFFVGFNYFSQELDVVCAKDCRWFIPIELTENNYARKSR
jgi:hypothetical protein